MTTVVPDVSDDALQRTESQLSLDFDYISKARQPDGLWIVTGYNLSLGSNEPFRRFIIAAAERTDLEPACLAALIDIEAAKSGPAGQWDPNSRNQASTACGLTQFVEGTWLGEARRAATFLNATVAQRNLAGDQEAILNLRFDPECSIMAAADYGSSNLHELIRRDLVDIAAADDDKARAIYLAHHDGLGGAEAWLRGQVDEEAARAKLVKAAGENAAEQAKVGHQTWADAYLTWIYSKVRPDRFRG